MDYKQFEGHTVGTNDFLVRNLREYANDLRVVNGILPKQDIVRAADLIESLKLELQKQKEKEIRGDRMIVYLEHQKAVIKSELQKQKELNAELVNGLQYIKKALGALTISQDTPEGRAYNEAESLIKKSSEI